ncbi:MAG: 2-succinyl-6-hydroxy-2,4-cyclohexadiene-1-carboxylate synthase [Actinomycetota bacterium]|nr:2-succinyl-6-hydroxy-2,4-cyclohexadiene-1-carboxylate synthase [Actinomycetota bacterium]
MSTSGAEGLSYTNSGDRRRPAVLFLHGFMGSSADWEDVMGALEGRFYCIAADLPGHGASLGLPDEAYTIEGAARRILEVPGELGIGRAALVGYSMGGRLALYLALRHPARCAGLFLESASPGLESLEERRSRRETDERRARRLETEDFGRFLEDWYRQPLFASLARDETLLARTIEARRRNDPGELARSLRGMGTGNQPSLWGELPGLQVPALAVAGGLDEKYAGISRLMANLNPLLESVVVPGVGHNVHIEAFEAYLASLRDFLDTL